ncbi:MAG: ABC transporter ATP-binding protein [Chloracidobacterium sp.]|nr:ABC transporter ATP-binding protein [Chloracidobacterium sp.]
MVDLEVRNLRVQLKKKIIIQNLGFQVSSGVLAILGPNGVGKSTLLRTMIGFLNPIDGDVLISQRSVFETPHIERAKTIALVPQEHHPAFSYSVEDLILMGRTPYLRALGFPSKDDRAIAESVMERLQIIDLRYRNYTTLSGGERRLVLLGLALCQQSKIILLDEPTIFLDIRNTYRVLSLIVDIAAKQNALVVITTHDINHVTECADQVLMMFDENQYAFGAVAELVTKANLKRLYNMDFEIVVRQDGRRFVMPQSG